MYLFEIVSMEPLTVPDGMKYDSFGIDEESLLFLEPSGPRIIRHSSQLRYLKTHEISRPYTSICFDPVENCYWACTGKNSDMIYKLTDAFCEIDRFQYCGYDTCFGSVKAVAYDRQGDCLILTFRSRVVTVDKHSFCEKAVNHCVCSQSYQSCIHSCGFHYYVSRRGGMETLTITKNGAAIIHAYLPEGHRILGMAEVCTQHGPSIQFLSVKHGVYYYMLQGVLISGQSSSTHATNACPCPEPRTPALPAEGDCSHLPPPETSGGACRQHCHSQEESHSRPTHPACAQEGHGHPHRRGGECHPVHYSSVWEAWYDSSVSIIESIALEQTALSHILNAEGEKIQKVIAVSDQPADFLDVNQSVLEIITKITHLEQVLFSKLDLACGALRERKSPQAGGE